MRKTEPVPCTSWKHSLLYALCLLLHMLVASTLNIWPKMQDVVEERQIQVRKHLTSQGVTLKGQNEHLFTPFKITFNALNALCYKPTLTSLENQTFFSFLIRNIIILFNISSSGIWSRHTAMNLLEESNIFNDALNNHI